ncbi:MAG: DUF2934 domain-containing protein [Sphingomonadaceae bacterium]
METDMEQRIRERAYELWQNEGQPQGHETRHWEQARAEFTEAQETKGQTPASMTQQSEKEIGAGRPASRRKTPDASGAPPNKAREGNTGSRSHSAGDASKPKVNKPGRRDL